MNPGIAYLLYMYDYACWGRNRVLEAAGRLPQADVLSQRGLDHGSIHSTMVHVFASEALWRQRWMGRRDATLMGTEAVPDVRRLREMWELEEAKLRALMGPLQDGDLNRQVEYLATTGGVRGEAMWQQMTQMLVHSVEHRSEVALALTALGESPGFLDFMAFIRER